MKTIAMHEKKSKNIVCSILSKMDKKKNTRWHLQVIYIQYTIGTIIIHVHVYDHYNFLRVSIMTSGLESKLKLVAWLYNVSLSLFYLIFVKILNFKAKRYIRYMVCRRRKIENTEPVYSMFLRSALVPYWIHWPSINYIRWLQAIFMLRKMYICTQATMISYIETFKCCAYNGTKLWLLFRC